MSSPLEYIDQLNFNTYKYPQYTHLIENCPNPNEKDKVIRICRCWQSKKFPYCDDTHKILMENGDSVGPYVAKLVSYKTSDEQKLRREMYNKKYMKLDNNMSLANRYKTIFTKKEYQLFPYINRVIKRCIFFSFFAITSSVFLFAKNEKGSTRTTYYTN